MRGPSSTRLSGRSLHSPDKHARTSLPRTLCVLVAVLLVATASRAALAQAPAGTAATQFVNGDFDDGPGMGWAEYSKQAFDVIVLDLAEGISPHSPRYAAWLGGADVEQAYVEQTVTITAAAPVLHYYHWVDSLEDYCTFDVARVYVGGNVVSTTGLCTANNTGRWAERRVDLSVFEGMTLPVRLQVDTDCCTLSSQYVDDVALQPSPLAPLVVSAGRNGGLVRLAWQHASPYAGYEVWRSQSPYFLISSTGSEQRAAVSPGSGPQTVYEDPGATGNAAANYFYLVRSAGAGATRTSNRTGEFDFPLVKGG